MNFDNSRAIYENCLSRAVGTDIRLQEIKALSINYRFFKASNKERRVFMAAKREAKSKESCQSEQIKGRELVQKINDCIREGDNTIYCLTFLQNINSCTCFLSLK